LNTDIFYLPPLLSVLCVKETAE